MRRFTAWLFLAAAAGHAAAPADPRWAYLSAGREPTTLGMLELARPLDESVIRLVGSGPAAGEAAARPPAPVGALKLEEPGPRPPGPDGPGFPPDARWPDAGGRITLPLPAAAPQAAGLRNPWEIRSAHPLSEHETVLECGGTLIGGEGGSVAIVNGRNVRRGDGLGEFRVAKIRSEGVLLERRGSYLVVPTGRRATVVASGD
jgi:hypothetical protein